MPRIPHRFHFVFGLRPQDRPFHLAHYLCLASCIEVNRPDEILFHYHNEPWGPWWERIRPRLTLNPIRPSDFVARHRGYARHVEGRYIRSRGLDYAHHADFVRLEVLLESGGVYADIDSLFIEPIPPDLFEAEFVLGEEGYVTRDDDGSPLRTLCNALIMSAPEARFGQQWYERMYAVFDGTWNRHSCLEAARLARDNPDRVSVQPENLFFPIPPTAAGLARLFAPSNAELDGASSVHLWEHLWADAGRTDFSRFHLDLLTEKYVRSGSSLYARLARRHL